MRKIFLLFFLVLPVFLVSYQPVYSQEDSQEVKITFDKVYSDYIGSVEEYNKAHSEYVLKRAQYLKFLSLKSRQDAIDATLVMLEKRDSVTVSYLKVLRFKLEEGIGIQDSVKDELYLRIDGEIEWFSLHKNNLTTASSLEDLVEDSKLASSRWPVVEKLAYEVTSILSRGKITDFYKRSDDIYANVKDKLEAIRNDGREGYSFSAEKFQVFDRWLFEAEGKMTRSKEKQDEADLLIIDINKNKKSSPKNIYNSVLAKLTESQFYLKDANSLLKEIVWQIKTEE